MKDAYKMKFILLIVMCSIEMSILGAFFFQTVFRETPRTSQVVYDQYAFDEIVSTTPTPLPQKTNTIVVSEIVVEIE